MDKEEGPVEGRGKGPIKKLGDYLYAWDGTKGYGHKIVVVSILFLVLVGFFVFRLTGSLDNGPIDFSEENIRERSERMSRVHRLNDSIDKVLEERRLMEEQQLRIFLEEMDPGSLDKTIEELLNIEE